MGLGDFRTAGALRAHWARLELAAIGCNLFAFVIVNYWIYASRSEYYVLHPLEAAADPPTISKAITDPAIGVPFHFWICLSAVLLALGTLPVGALYVRTARELPQACWRTRGIIRILSPLALISQLAACTGMAILSTWRGPDHGDGHMIGSYIFFASQIAAILCVGLMCSAIARDAEAGRVLRRFSLLHPAMCRVRGAFALAAVFLALLYVVLFLVKGFDFQFGYDVLYQLYVWVEPLAISCFLAVLASYSFELAAAGGAINPSRRLPSAEPMPD